MSRSIEDSEAVAARNRAKVLERFDEPHAKAARVAARMLGTSLGEEMLAGLTDDELADLPAAVRQRLLDSDFK